MRRVSGTRDWYKELCGRHSQHIGMVYEEKLECVLDFTACCEDKSMKQGSSRTSSSFGRPKMLRIEGLIPAFVTLSSMHSCNSLYRFDLFKAAK